MAVDDRDSVRDTRTLIGILIRCGAWHIESLAITCMAVDDEVLRDEVVRHDDAASRRPTTLAGVESIVHPVHGDIRLAVPAVQRAVVVRLTDLGVDVKVIQAPIYMDNH